MKDDCIGGNLKADPLAKMPGLAIAMRDVEASKQRVKEAVGKLEDRLQPLLVPGTDDKADSALEPEGLSPIASHFLAYSRELFELANHIDALTERLDA